MPDTTFHTGQHLDSQPRDAARGSTSGAPPNSDPRHTVVHLDEVTHWFPSTRSVQVALSAVSLRVQKGEFVCLVGPSGCGKTTLLNMISGQLHPQRGTVHVRTEAPAASAVGYMFARDSLMPWRTIRDNVAYGPELRHVGRRERLCRAEEMLNLVGLAGREHLHPSQLSHGMRQRANLARTLAIDPELLLVDEPFGALDAQTKARLQGEFVRIWEGTGKTVVFVTHDLNEAALMADRIIMMRDGVIRRDLRVGFSRPRNLDELRFDPAYQELVQSVWDLFSEGDEQ